MHRMRNRNMIVTCAVALAAACIVLAPLRGLAEPDYWHDETEAERDARMAWWREARFGMFIHWGLYAAAAGEWDGRQIPGIGEWIQRHANIPEAEYRKLLDEFNPVDYDPVEWVRIAKDAGMKYIVITAKHHDGFCLWDSDHTDYDITATPYGQDLLGPLAEACREAGITLGFYYSIIDWQHPHYGDASYATVHEPDMERYNAFMEAQLAELFERYGPLGVLWFDGEWEGAWTHEHGKALYQYVRSLQPSVLINNRVDKGRGGHGGMTHGDHFRGDFGTPEQQIPPQGLPGVDWETCQTMNDTWGFKKNDHNWKSSEVLIRQLVDIASKGGNFLLNVGPTAKGEIPAPSVERLADMGAWMRINGESIYDTTASRFPRLPWGRSTTRLERNGATLYLHVFDWPDDGELLVPGLHNRPRSARLLDGNVRLRARQTDDGVVIRLPATAPDPMASVIRLQVRGDLEITVPAIRQAEDGVLTLLAARANIHGPTLITENIDGIESLGYWTSVDAWADWPIRVHTPGTFTVHAVTAGLEATTLQWGLGDDLQSADLPATGSYGDFQTRELGTLTIEKSGEHTLTLRPAADQWEPVNLRSVTLTPVP